MALISPVFLSACDQDNADNSRLHIPGPDFKADTSIGKRLFSTNCIKCHGSGARGTDKGPPLVDKTYRPGHHGDMVFHFAVSKGTKQHHWHFGDMPPVPNLSPEDVGNIIAYVRLEQKKAGIK
jgi:mono/diheme cytochrome c family protein